MTWAIVIEGRKFVSLQRLGVRGLCLTILFLSLGRVVL
jgi:hypothetical protein